MNFTIAAAILAAAALGSISLVHAGEPQKSSSPSTRHPLDSQDLEAWLDGLLPYALNSGDIAGAEIGRAHV